MIKGDMAMRYYSQIGQDQFLNESIFQGKENGFFVDIGAHNGITFSNSYFFERHKNWQGLCIEPMPNIYKLLRENRRCICIEGAISFENGVQEFLSLAGHTEMYSCLLTGSDPRHLERIQREMQRHGGNQQVIQVKTYTLQSILDDHHVKSIDFCSIDTEGNELTVLQSVDWEKVDIKCLVVENSYQDRAIRDYLETKKYKLIERLEWDDIYLRE
ncbi:MAG: FkbM family methyltransferase [Bacillota bacterium]|nr:FkbM family methyltransferase [Bacillota bacterium]